MQNLPLYHKHHISTTNERLNLLSLPKKVLPTIANTYPAFPVTNPPIENQACPIIHNAKSTFSATFSPNLSTKTPLKNGITILGYEYTEYNILYLTLSPSVILVSRCLDNALGWSSQKYPPNSRKQININT